MGAVASIPASRAAQVLPGTTSPPRSPSPTSRPPPPHTAPPPAASINAPTRVDSGLWTGNRMLFGPHFILRYPLTRPPLPTNLPPNTFVTPGASELGTAALVTDQLAATAASAASLGPAGTLAGITPEMIAGWRAGRNEINPHPGELHVVTSALRCVVNVRRLSLSMPLLPSGGQPSLDGAETHGDHKTHPQRCNLTFVVDSEVPCLVKVYLLVQEQEGKILHHMVPAICSSPVAEIPLPAGMGQVVDLAAHDSPGILVHDLLYHYGALLNMYFPAATPSAASSSSSPASSPLGSPRSTSPLPPIPSSLPPPADNAAAAFSRSSTPLLPVSRPASPGTFPSPPLTNTAPIYPLVIVVSGVTDDQDDRDPTTCTEQWTMVAIDPRDWEPRVIKQKLWLPRPSTTSLLLQEIYGFTAGDGSASAANDPGQQPECIVCMADVKDTMVLPCRHLCLCKECGNQLRRQSSKCPICRQDFHSLLHVATAPVKESQAVDAAVGASGKGPTGKEGGDGGDVGGAGQGRVQVMRTAPM